MPLSENEKLIIQLEQELKEANENHRKIFDLVDEIFNKIDSESKEFFVVKSKLDTLKEVTSLKIVDIQNQIDQKLIQVNKDITSNKASMEKEQKRFDDFKKEDFKPISDYVEQAKGSARLMKFVYPIIGLIFQVGGFFLAYYLAVHGGS